MGHVKLMLLFLFLILSACSDDMGGFQKNVPDPDFVLFDMFENEPSLDEIWDLLDQEELNRKLAEMIKQNKEDFIIFSRINRDIMEDADIFPEMMKDTRGLVNLLRTTDKRFMDTRDLGSFYSKSPSEYRRIMYALSDRLRRDCSDKKTTDSILAMAQKITSFMTDSKSPEMLQTDMSELVKSINELERNDFILLTKNIGKVLAAASYPMWIKNPEFSISSSSGFGILETDYSAMKYAADSGLGNAVKGSHSLISGLRDRADGRIADRDLAYDFIRDLRNTFLKKENSAVIKDFVYTLEKYFTQGGAVYNHTSTTNSDVDLNLYNTNSAALYSDAELIKTLKETIGAQMGLFLRDDRCGALTPDPDSKSYILERFSRRLRDTGIDWKNAGIEESLYDAMVVDPYGRDRRSATSPDGRKPYAISFLEDFFFLGGITNNFGWKDGGNKNEVSGAEVCNEHGHGEPTNYMTFNDSLFSIATKKFLGKGTYELAIENGNRRDHIYRSYLPFKKSDRNRYRFYYDQDYCALDFVTGGAVGDLGLPDNYNGGNVNGNNNDPMINSFRPFNGNGIDEKGLVGWTLAWVSRVCFEGEGPYYYKDPGASAISINGETYYKYMRPNGKIYAYVHYGNDGKSDKYLYPADGNDPLDKYPADTDPDYPQRDNRFRSTWYTDYYMITNNDQSKCYTPNTLDGSTEWSGALKYNELIEENDPARGCSSQEEAIFRNFQWLMTEKKFVIVIPMWIRGPVLGLTVESAVFQIIEGHGYAGICPARKYRGNRVWAKANTSGVSKIPGDYRLDVRVATIVKAIGIVPVDEKMIYDNILGNGPATFSVAFHALAPLYRLGFPRSPLISDEAYTEGYGEHGEMNFEHYQLGSKQFAVGDDNWNKRNMLLPILGALINVLHESATPDSKTIANFADGLMPLLKPLFFYNNNADNGVCTDSFLPRINGEGTSTSYHYSHSKSLIPEEYIRGFSGSTSDRSAWFGGWSVRDYYMAAPVTTLFSSLIDRTGITPGNPDSNLSGRAGGILPLLTRYDMNRPRSVSNRAQTRMITNIVDQLVKLSDSKYNDKPGTIYASADFDNTQYINWGVRRRILYGFEQLMSASKVSKTPYIEKLQKRSAGRDVAYGGTATKMQRIPEWIFQQRDVDIDMDGLINRIVGFDDPDGNGPLKGSGLSAYPDDKPGYSDWIDFDDSLNDMAEIFDNFLTKDARYNITEDMLDMTDILLSKQITDDELASSMFTSGKLFAWNNGTKWIWQGEEEYDTPENPQTDFSQIWRLTKNYIPLIHKKISPDDNDPSYGNNYMAVLNILSYALRKDGLAPFVMDITLSADTELIIDDIYEFLGEDFVTGGGAMWITLADLLDDLSCNIESTTSESVSDIFSGYGFQQNGF